jgi:hypothetical protein
MRIMRACAVVFCILNGAATGCSGSADDLGTGQIDLNLVGAGPSGALYRLRHAIITVDGPSSAVFATEDDPDRTSLSANVPTGDYIGQVQPGWQLERIQGSTVTPVNAELVSDNPTSFTVLANQRTIVPLRFRVELETIDMTQGYDIVVTVEETSHHEASGDAMIDSSTPDTNLGTQPFLFALGSSFDIFMRSLIQFDLSAISSGSQVRSAHLIVDMSDQAGVEFAIQVHRIIDPWSEAGVTWNAQPSFSPEIEASLDFQGLGPWRFDITALVQRWVTTPADNQGLMLIIDPELHPLPNTGHFARFDSREGVKPPQLEVVVGN